MALLIVCAYTDLKRGKIYNWAVFAGLLGGFVISGIQFSPKDDALLSPFKIRQTFHRQRRCHRKTSREGKFR